MATKTEILAEMYARFRAAILSRGGEEFVPPESKDFSYTKKPGFSITLALLLCLVLIAPAFARDWHLARFDTQMSVAQDGVVDVTERLDVVFDGTYHGIWRDIPIEYPGPHGSNYTLFLQVTGVTDGTGNDLKFDSTTQNGNRHLTIYIPDAVNATRTVQIHYTVTNAVRWFDDHDELYWNVTGNDWPVPIESGAAHIVFPANASGELRAQAFTGEYGSRAQDATVQVGGNSVSVETTGPLSMREGLTADVYITKGVLTQPSQSDAGHLVPAQQLHRVSGKTTGLILVLVPIVLFFAVLGKRIALSIGGVSFSHNATQREASNSNFSHYQPLSSADYPRTYRMSPGWRAKNLIVGFVAISIGFSVLRSALAGPQVRVSWLVWGIFFSIVGILAIVQGVNYRVVLFADRIEVRNLASTRVLRRDEILGRRLVEVRGSQIIRLVPRGGQRLVKVNPLVLKTDSAFWEWMDTVPDLDVP